jgi:hypothetical protein
MKKHDVYKIIATISLSGIEFPLIINALVLVLSNSKSNKSYLKKSRINSTALSDLN